MNCYFIYLSYKGTNYHGWQVQENAVTVQGKLNDALSTLLKEDVNTIGAGRTDTGVHAKHYVAHFDTITGGLENNPKFLYSLNSIIPVDISVSKIVSVKPSANARFDAILRGYEYIICTRKNPFLLDFAWMYYNSLNINNMQIASDLLLNYTDFTSFSKTGSDNKTNICKVYQASWTIDGELIKFNIKANRFLRNMVRAIVGTLVEVGKGRITPDNFAEIIEAKDRSLAGTSAPANGLYLDVIDYPETIFNK